MLAKILIRREFKAGRGPEILALLNELRTGALAQGGYISGETLRSVENPELFLVIGTWESIEDWKSWKEDPKRKRFESMLEIYQKGPTVYEEFLLRAPPPSGS